MRGVAILAQAFCRLVDKGGDKNIVAFTSHPWPLLITPHQLLNHLFLKKILITIEVPDSTSPSPSTTRYCTPGVHNLMEKRQLGLRLFTGSTCINKNTVYTYSYQDALMNPRLQALLTRPDVWQASQRAANEARNVLPTGHTLLDSALHQGGWPHAALTELLTDGCGIGEMQLLAPALAHCSRDPRRLFFLSPPYLPYAPSLHALGLRLERLQLVSAQPGSDTLWCAEQILRSGACSCLLAWLPGSRQADYPALRRLQLAARASSGPAFLFRPTHTARALSPAALRLVLRGTANRLAVEIVKQRGGRAGQCISIARSGTLLQARIDPSMLPTVMPGAAGVDCAATAPGTHFRKEYPGTRPWAAMH